MSFVTTGDYSYGRALRPRITFKSIDGLTTYFTYDAFAGSNPINVTHLETEGAVGESGTFNILVEDSNNLIASSGLRSAKVFIELGKSNTTFKYFMIGYGDIFATSRPQTRYKLFNITGLGSAVQSSQLYIHRRQASKIQEIDDPTSIPDPKYNTNQLVKAALENKNWRPLKDKSIKDITGWLTTGISDLVNINVPVVNAPFTYLNDFLDQLCSISGAVWFIDFSTGQEVFTLTYNTDLLTGVTIKSGDLQNRLVDDATKTGYIKTAFNVEDSAMGETGVATRLYTSTIIERAQVASSKDDKGSTTLNNRAIAQQVIINNDSRRITSIGLQLRKIGDPDSPQSRINGDIVLDKDNKPTGAVVGTFEVPLSSIDTGSSQLIFIEDLNVKESLLTGGETKIWIRLFQRSGTNGQPQNDPNNTIAWHHSGVFNGSALSTYSATAPEGDRDKKDSLDWSSATNTGPTYRFAVFSNIRRLIARTNQGAAKTLRMREVFIPTDFITDTKNASKYMSLTLSETSKPRRSVSEYRATIPNNFIYKPYQWVTFIDGLSGTSQDLQVKRVRYVIGSQPGDAQIGTLHAELTLGGLYNPLLADCSC